MMTLLQMVLFATCIFVLFDIADTEYFFMETDINFQCFREQLDKAVMECVDDEERLQFLTAALESVKHFTPEMMADRIKAQRW